MIDRYVSSGLDLLPDRPVLADLDHPHGLYIDIVLLLSKSWIVTAIVVRWLLAAHVLEQWSPGSLPSGERAYAPHAWPTSLVPLRSYVDARYIRIIERGTMRTFVRTSWVCRHLSGFVFRSCVFRLVARR